MKRPWHALGLLSTFLLVGSGVVACDSVTETPAAGPTGDSSNNEDGAGPDGVDSELDSGSAEIAVPSDGAMDGETAVDADVPDGTPACGCAPAQHCDDDGNCVADVCNQGAATCSADLQARLLCNADGSAFETVPCSEGSVCELGQCVALVCEPRDPPECALGGIEHCNGAGTGFVWTPCPGGTECQGGTCVPVQPNVLLLVDTSGSMTRLYATGAKVDECEGAACPPWELPNCDDADAPKTRLGRVKQALHEVINDPATLAVRLGLQRFPRAQLFPALAENANCNYGYFSAQDSLLDDPGTHSLPKAFLESHLWQFLPVPFDPGGGNGADQLALWTDYSQEVVAETQPCVTGLDCPDKLCMNGLCHAYANPELQAAGKSPLGKSLFYAGEYFRQQVLVEGRACGSDANCASPHHSCVDGVCQDPYAACRPNLVIVFSDGGESVHTAMGDFFHPRVQAKRLRYGLGCETDADCAGGATCVAERCAPPEISVPAKVCRSVVKACETDAECPAYPCGQLTDCPGVCESVGLDYTDASQGANVLRDAAGDPVSVRVHVVDASVGEANGAGLVAQLGGGLHVPVTYEDLPALVDSFLPLFDIKADAGMCE